MWIWTDLDTQEIHESVHLMEARSLPVSDEEAEVLERLCQSATPGPIVPDDLLDGEGTLVCTLPDGRHLVSVHPPSSCPEHNAAALAANAQLICEARSVILRLLRDRERAKRREECLRQRIRSLETRLAQLERRFSSDGRPRRPR